LAEAKESNWVIFVKIDKKIIPSGKIAQDMLQDTFVDTSRETLQSVSRRKPQDAIQSITHDATQDACQKTSLAPNKELIDRPRDVNLAIIDFPPLTEGILLKRYKRFLVDVKLKSGEVTTAHTSNTGAMLNCSEAGRSVYLSESSNPKRKYRYSLEMISMPDGLVGLNTALPNRLAALGCQYGLFEGFPFPAQVQREVAAGGSRLDLKLTGQNGEVVWVEVKSSTLVIDGVALFPDAVSSRGTKHLNELIDLLGPSQRAAILILVQRSGAASFSPADSIDPLWGKTLREAVKRGVELLAYEVDLSPTGARLSRKIESVL
jgi:sugar fermentation stimulation protein A